MEQDIEPRNNPCFYAQLIFDKGGKNIQWSKDCLFNKWCWENWTDACKKINESSHQITPYTRINSKWIKDWNTTHDTIKVLEENIGSKISDIPCCNSFADMSPRAMEKQVNKWDTQQKKPLTKWKGNLLYGPILASGTSDKWLISKICKGFMQLNTRKTNNPI